MDRIQPKDSAASTKPDTQISTFIQPQSADGCLVCQAPLEYLQADEIMECSICHKKEPSKTRCVSGHYVCNDCHMRGIDSVAGICLRATSANPVEIANEIMAQPFCHMHGPEHHVIVGAALLTAYKNAGGVIDLPAALAEMFRRGKSVPGGACGFWGACGAGISAGIFVSLITGSSPLATEPFGLANRMTSAALERIGAVGGPRCCKRDSYLSLLAAADFVGEQFGVQMERTEVVCGHAARNDQCVGSRCPFSPDRVVHTAPADISAQKRSVPDGALATLKG